MITFALLTLEVYDNVFVGIEIDYKGFQSRNCNINVFNKLWIQLIKAVVSHLNNYLTSNYTTKLQPYINCKESMECSDMYSGL